MNANYRTLHAASENDLDKPAGRAAGNKKAKSIELRELIAKRLKVARMTYDEQAAPVARSLGIAKQTLQAYESGRTYPDEAFLVRFANLTGCPIDFIFRGLITHEMPAAMAARIGQLAPELINVGPADRARRGEREGKPE